MLRLGLTLVATLRSALRTHQDLVLENLALRHQLELLTRGDRRARFRPVDRLLWVGLRRCWTAWREALVLVQPATVLRWHREGFRHYWRRRSQPRPGRPRVAAAMRTLIRQMARANPLCGASSPRTSSTTIVHEPISPCRKTRPSRVRSSRPSWAAS